MRLDFIFEISLNHYNFLRDKPNRNCISIFFFKNTCVNKLIQPIDHRHIIDFVDTNLIKSFDSALTCMYISTALTQSALMSIILFGLIVGSCILIVIITVARLLPIKYNKLLNHFVRKLWKTIFERLHWETLYILKTLDLRRVRALDFFVLIWVPLATVLEFYRFNTIF